MFLAVNYLKEKGYVSILVNLSLRGCGLARHGDGLQRINDEQRVYRVFPDGAGQ